MTPTVTLVVVNHRSAALTDRMLETCAGGADEVVVVDCTPGDPGLADVAARHGARLVEPGANLGYGRGANLGAAGVTNDVLVVANPDVRIEGAALRGLAATAAGVGLVAPQFTFPDGSLQRSAHDREPRFVTSAFDLSVAFQAVARRVRPGWHPTLLPAAAHETRQPCRHVLGALMAVDLAAFRAVGGFDEAFFLYREETDLCRRLRAAGWAVWHDPSVTAIHDSGGSSSRTGVLAARPEHLRSHFLYIRRHWGPLAAALARVIGLTATATSVLTGPDRSSWSNALRTQLAVR